MLRSLVFAFCVAAAPAVASGLKITVEGEASGVIEIDLLEDIAPNHVAQITQLANDGFYDDVYFHRVMKGFMAQTGDGQYGKVGAGDMRRAGTGDSNLPNLNAEFSDIPFERGVVGMARTPDINSANSQFFIMFDTASHLGGQYTVVGRVTSGLDVLDAIKLGRGGNGAIIGEPDRMTRVEVTE